MKIGEVKINVDRMERGGWVKIPDLQGVSFHSRGAGNRDWKKLNAKLIEEIPRKRKVSGRLTQEDQDALITELVLRTSLLGWEGIEDDDGAPIPFTPERAREFLTNPEYQRIRDAMLWAAYQVAETEAEEVQETSGKS